MFLTTYTKAALYTVGDCELSQSARKLHNTCGAVKFMKNKLKLLMTGRLRGPFKHHTFHQ